MMQLAIQESLLPEATTLERFQRAKTLGLAGVEIRDANLVERIAEINDASTQTGVAVSAVNSGYSRLLHPEFAERERAIVKLREAMAQALDIGTTGVIFIPHYQTTPALPDLHPYKSSAELEGALLIAQLKATMGDLAYALGATLHMAVVSPQQAHLINRLEQADRVLKGNSYHDHLKLCVTTCDLMSEESNPIDALAHHHSHIRTVHLMNPKRGLPNSDDVNFDTMLSTLKAYDYDGWLTIAGDHVDTNTDEYFDQLAQSVTLIRGLC